MSYEGYTEYKCACGEIDSADVYDDQPAKCACGKPFIASREVDETNLTTDYGEWTPMKKDNGVSFGTQSLYPQPLPELTSVDDSFCDQVLARPDVKTAIADEAKKIVAGARRSAYGRPEQNFERIAHYWNAYAKCMGWPVEFTAADVSPMMRGVKEARLCETPDHRDSFVDLVGYALTGSEVNGVAA